MEPETPVCLSQDRFLVMGLIGFLVGLVGFLLHQLIDLIAETKWSVARDLVQRDLFLGWLWVVGYSLAFLLPREEKKRAGGDSFFETELMP